MQRLLTMLSLVLFVAMAGCSGFGASEDAPVDLTGVWLGSLVTPGGEQHGLTLRLTQFDDELSGSYRESEALQNGRVRVSGGSLEGVVLEDGRIEVLLGESRLCKVRIDGDQLSGTYTVVSRPSLRGTLAVER